MYFVIPAPKKGDAENKRGSLLSFAKGNKQLYTTGTKADIRTTG